MRNSIKSIAIAAFSALSMVSCSEEKIVPQNKPVTPMPAAKDTLYLVNKVEIAASGSNAWSNGGSYTVIRNDEGAVVAIDHLSNRDNSTQRTTVQWNGNVLSLIGHDMYTRKFYFNSDSTLSAIGVVIDGEDIITQELIINEGRVESINDSYNDFISPITYTPIGFTVDYSGYNETMRPYYIVETKDSMNPLALIGCPELVAMFYYNELPDVFFFTDKEITRSEYRYSDGSSGGMVYSPITYNKTSNRLKSMKLNGAVEWTGTSIFTFTYDAIVK